MGSIVLFELYGMVVGIIIGIVLCHYEIIKIKK